MLMLKHLDYLMTTHACPIHCQYLHSHSDCSDHHHQVIKDSTSYLYQGYYYTLTMQKGLGNSADCDLILFHGLIKRACLIFKFDHIIETGLEICENDLWHTAEDIATHSI